MVQTLHLRPDTHKEAQRRNPKYIPPEKCVVECLPPEILALIFEIGTQMVEESEDGDLVEEDDGDEEYEDVDSDEDSDDESVGTTGRDWDPKDDADGLANDNETPLIRFQLRVSHVCRRWRQVALDTPTLWTRVTLDEIARGVPEQYDMSHEWIRRSKAMPLDILLDVSDVDEISGYGGENEEILEAAENIERAAQLLLPESDRWQTFELKVSVYSHMTIALEALSKATSAAMLKTLSLYHLDEDEEANLGAFSPATHRKYHKLFGGRMPALRELVLWGVHVDWSMFVPSPELDVESFNTPPVITTNLTVLELAYHATDVRPSFAVFMHTLRCAPHLSSLLLSGSGPLFPGPEEAFTPLSLPALQLLRLAFLELSLALLLVRVLYIPNLNAIELEFEDDCTSLLQALVQPMKEASTSKSTLILNQLTSTSVPPFGIGNVSKDNTERSPCVLSSVKDVKLSGFPCSYNGAARAFYTACPLLETLHLNMCFLEESFFGVLMEDLNGVPIDALALRRAGRKPSASASVDRSDSSSMNMPRNGLEEGNSSMSIASRSSNLTTSTLAGPIPAGVPSSSSFSPSVEDADLKRRLKIAQYPVPFLKTLTVSDISGSDLRKLVEARKAIECPLQRLYIDEEDKDDAGGEVFKNDFHWLKRNVETVEWVEISDDEADFMSVEDEDEENVGEGEDAGADVEDLDFGEEAAGWYHMHMNGGAEIHYHHEGTVMHLDNLGIDLLQVHGSDGEWETEPEDNV